MAASSFRPKVRAPLFFLAAALLFFLLCGRGLAARPVPTTSTGRHTTSQHAVPTSSVEDEKSGSSGPAGTTMTVMDQQDEPESMPAECEGAADEDDCLMRRTLVAHTDYIYTQGKHN